MGQESGVASKTYCWGLRYPLPARASPQGAVVLFLVVILFHLLSMEDQKTREMELRGTCWPLLTVWSGETCCSAIGQGAPLPLPAPRACGPSCHLEFQLIFDSLEVESAGQWGRTHK